MTWLICVVDDSDIDRYIAKRRLEKSGSVVAVIEADSGEDFLERIDQEWRKHSAADLAVLMDINMPGLSGFETLAELKTLMDEQQPPADMKAWIYSSSSHDEDKERAAASPGVVGYITKPMDSESAEALLAALG